DRQPIARKYRPALENLEGRSCPSVNVVVHGHTLFVQGDAADNTVTITDQGDGHISATITGSSGTATNSGAGIRNVIVTTQGGSDTVNYTLASDLTSNLNLGIDLGAYRDAATAVNTVNLDFSQHAVSSPHLGIGILGTSGKDNV